MNISEAFGETDFSEDFGEYEDSFGEDYGEAARPRGKQRMSPIAPKKAHNAYQPRPNTSHVTQAQLQAALERVSAQINASTAAIKAVDTRVRNVATETERTGIAMRKEIAERKKEITGVRKDLQNTREMAAILPLLSSIGGGKGAMFAPLLLLGGDVSGGTDASSSGASAFSGTTGMIALLAIAGGLGK